MGYDADFVIWDPLAKFTVATKVSHISNFECLLMFSSGRRSWKNQNKYSKFEIRHIQIDELPRTQVYKFNNKDSLFLIVPSPQYFQNIMHKNKLTPYIGQEVCKNCRIIYNYKLLLCTRMYNFFFHSLSFSFLVSYTLRLLGEKLYGMKAQFHILRRASYWSDCWPSFIDRSLPWHLCLLC